MNTVNFCIIYLILINFCHFPNICLTSVSCSPLLRTKRKRDTIVCVQRCDRIFERSLRRIDESRETLQNLLDKQRPKQKANDACWKSFDYLDCMQHCEVSDRHQLTKTARLIKSRCRSFVKGHEAELMCISRFHSFVEIRCSAYLHEAIRLSKLGIKRKHETCRHLHYHNLCLENSISNFCSDANKIFSRLNLRDYFLSFILPDDDQYFSDDFLDDCQIYEFVNVNEQSMSTTEATQQDSPSSYSYAYKVSQVTHPDKLLDDVAYITTTTPPAPSTLNVGVLTTTETDATAVAIETKTDAGTTKKLLFSPDRDLEFTPPNFFYSSQRSPLPVQTTTTRTAVDYHPSHDSSQENHLDLVTLPMSIITHQVTADNSYENDGDERSQAVTYPSATLERHSNLQSIGKATHIEVSSSPRATTQQVHEWSESSVGSTRLITALSNDEFEDPSENSHQTKSYDDVQHPRHHPDHSGTASTTHRASADQIEDEQRFASVIAVTPHRATIKPVGDFYTDLNYDSSEEEGGDVQTSKTTTKIQMSTYDASEVPSKSIYTPILPHVHHSTSVIDNSSLATNQLVEHLYEHQPDAELLTPTVPSAAEAALITEALGSMTSLVPLEETTSEPFEQSKTSSIEQTYDHKKTPQAQSPDSPHQIASSWSDYSESDYSERFYDLQTDPFDEFSSEHLSDETDYRSNVLKPSTYYSGSNHPVHSKAVATLTSSFLAKQSVAQNGKKLSSTKTDLSSGQHSAGVERQKATSSLFHGELTKRPPIFEGRRVYVKPIRSWKEPLDDDDSQRQLKNEKDSWYDSDLSRKRTKVNMKNEYERTSSLRNRWDNIYRTVPDEHVFAKTEVLPSEYGGRLHSTGDDSKRRNGIRDDSIFLDVHNNRTVIESGSSGDGVKFLPDDHNAIMLFIYATLVLVALLTMAGFLVTLAMRRYLV